MTVRKKPVKPQPPLKWGWWEVRRALFTGAIAVGSGLAAVATSDNVKAVLEQPGLLAAGIGVLLSAAHFIALILKDNTK